MYGLKAYLAKLPLGTPRQLTLISSVFQQEDGTQTCIRSNIHMDNGDLESVLDMVHANGGIGKQQEDGSFIFSPWPPAAITVRDLSQEEYETLRDSEPQNLGQ
jgi:hypothetical protein